MVQWALLAILGTFGGEAVRLPSPPSWSRNVAIYEVNLRQYSPGGTFAEFASHLPRLRDLGVGILWLMPIHPIGQVNRKGTLGSYYSVKDYLAVNPEHGTMEEFKDLVRAIHDHGMYVIMDWVANHTAWDSRLAREHPDWFTRGKDGLFTPPVPDWTDVIDLDYRVPEVSDYMVEAMAFWVREADVDGFRCDVAGMVPLSLWKRARRTLDSIKPVFMLAEWDHPSLHPWFDMTYDWKLFRTFNAVAQGKASPQAILRHVRRDRASFPSDAYRMQFTSNHDENSWHGSEYERLGDGVEVFAVLAATLPDMLLIYSGQEAGLDRRLAFFEKDPIQWRPHRMAGVYQKLLALKRQHPSLWNGKTGGRVVPLKTKDEHVVAFARVAGPRRVVTVANLSPLSRDVRCRHHLLRGAFTDPFSGQASSLDGTLEVTLGPWDYLVLAD